MALNGVRQLKKLTIAYCEHSGSSQGLRYSLEFSPILHTIFLFILQSELCAALSGSVNSRCLPSLTLPCPRALLVSPVRQQLHDKNPHLEIVYRKSNGRHPQLIAEYVNGSKMPISLRNLGEQGEASSSPPHRSFLLSELITY